MLSPASRAWLLGLWDGAVDAYRDYSMARGLYLSGALRERTVRHWHGECVWAASAWTRTASAYGWVLLTPATTARGC